jgi:hypothetical protein
MLQVSCEHIVLNLVSHRLGVWIIALKVMSIIPFTSVNAKSLSMYIHMESQAFFSVISNIVGSNLAFACDTVEHVSQMLRGKR